MAEMMQQPPGQPAPGQQPPQAQGQPRGDDRLQRIVQAAGRIMYVNPTADRVLDMLRKGPPPQALAMTTLFLLQTLQQESKNRIPPELVTQAVPPILSMLAELQAAGGVEITPEAAEQAEGFVMEQLQKAGQGGQQAAPAQEPPAEEPPPETEQQPGLIAGAMQ